MLKRPKIKIKFDFYESEIKIYSVDKIIDTSEQMILGTKISFFKAGKQNVSTLFIKAILILITE